MATDLHVRHAGPIARAVAMLVALLAGCGDKESALPDANASSPDAAAPSPDAGPAEVTNTTDLVLGIATQVDDAYAYPGKPPTEPKTPIATSVESVTYRAPVEIRRGDLTYWEVTGTIRGVGWGGYSELVDGSASKFVGLNDAHYDYDATFVLRWNPDWNGVLDVYNHGGWLLSTVYLAMSYAGEGGLDDASHLEREGDWLVSDSVLGDARKHAYFAINSLLKEDGTPAAIAKEGPYAGRPVAFCGDGPIARDTTQVGQRLIAKLAQRPVALTLGMGHSFGAIRVRNLNFGNATFMNRFARVTLSFVRTSGGVEGTIPGGTLVSADGGEIVFATASDIIVPAGQNGPFDVLAEALFNGARANVAAGALHNVSGLFDETLTVSNPLAATGGSTVPARTGDVHVKAYDPTSAKIYDGMLLFAYGCAPDSDPFGLGTCVLDPDRPMAVPMSVIRGQLEGTLDDVRLVSVLDDAGVDVASSVRIYQVRNLPHDWDEIWFGTPNLAAALNMLGIGEIDHAGRMAPMVAPIVDDMVSHLQRGTPLMPSRIDGAVGRVGDHDAVLFQQVHRLPGSDPAAPTTSLIPFADDPTLDVIAPELQVDTADFAAMFSAVELAMPHVAEPIVLPETACRAGGLTMYSDDSLDGWYVAFDDLNAVWGSAETYQTCLDDAAARLAADGLYDLNGASTALPARL